MQYPKKKLSEKKRVKTTEIVRGSHHGFSLPHHKDAPKQYDELHQSQSYQFAYRVQQQVRDDHRH